MDNALGLFTEGSHIYLRIEVKKGQWVDLIKERIDGPISHIIEPIGIKQKIKEKEG